MSDRFLCIHGHFYQPPRENPYFEEVFRQKSASPYHDWNERIFHESYLPNSASRILDGKGKIKEIMNNYNTLSFNFGPTLINWIRRKHPEFLLSLKEADKQNVKKFGSGNAIAQAHSHIIMPLANERDIKTQTVWGIKSFQNLFGRRPEGMWLPETAVDLKTLKCLAENGIRFVILGAHQCEEVKTPDGKWINVDESSLDVTRPYKVSLDGERFIWVFFFHRPLSGELSFGGLLKNGDLMAERIINEASNLIKERVGLLLLACDGETFGHHHKFGEMALSRAIKVIEERGILKIAPLEYVLSIFEKLPPWEAKIRENTSWSCAHGIRRWEDDCGCSTGGEPNWHQKWRAPLREAINFLVTKSDALFESLSEKAFKDPELALNEYIDVLEGEKSPSSFLEEHLHNPNKDADLGLMLLELERMKMYSQTSCGWFFSDISGIETVQILLYASRCISIYREITGINLEQKFKDILRKAPGNRVEFPNGEVVYEKLVLPQTYDRDKILATASLLAKANEDSFKIGAIEVKCSTFYFPSIGEYSLQSGKVQAEDTRVKRSFSSFFINLKLKDLSRYSFLIDTNNEGMRRINERLLQMTLGPCREEEALECIKSLKPHSIITLKDLPTDYRERILEQDILKLKEKLQDIATDIYRRNKDISKTLKKADIEIPPIIRASTDMFFEMVLNEALTSLASQPISSNYVQLVLSVMDEAASMGAKPDISSLISTIEKRYIELMDLYIKDGKESLLKEIGDILKITQKIKFALNIWSMQNKAYQALKSLPQLSEGFKDILINLGFSEELVQKKVGGV